MPRGKKPGKVTEMPGGNIATAEPEDAPPPDSPHIASPPKVQTKREGFFERINAIPKADWGTRAYIYVYCLEPICNLKMGGETKYLVKLQEPLADEQPLMVDYGSGKYRLQFVYRKPGAQTADSIDIKEIEIYNPKFPPKIPRSVWMNDPRNERWAALLPKEEVPRPETPLGTVTDAFKTFTEMQREVRAEVTAGLPVVTPPPPPNEIGKFTEMVTALKTIMPQAPASTDNTMLQTIVTLLTSQIKSSQDEANQLRQQMFELMTKQQNAAPAASGENLETLIDKFSAIAPKLQNILGIGGEKVTDIVHGRKRAWWEEVLVQGLPAVMQNAAPLLPMLAGRMLGGPPAANPLAPAVPQAQQQALPPAAPNPMQETQVRVANFLGSNLTPMRKVFEDYLRGVPRDPDDKEAGIIDGSDFAAWVHEYHGAEILKDARSLGSGNILLMFKQSPLWAQLAPYEVKLSEFLDQALRYDPPADEPAATEETPAEL